MTGVPTATPTEATFRVSWEVIEIIPEGVTVRIRKAAPAPDSDGIPVAVEAEVSRRGTSGHITARHYELTSADKVTVLVALAELAFRHGHGEIVEYPILVPDGGVKLLVLRWQRFSRWFLTLATFEFEEIRPLLAGLSHRVRAGGIAFLKTIADVIPNLKQFEDTPHLLLQL